MAAWRLQLAQEALAAHVKKEPKCVRVLALAAELKLEARLGLGLGQRLG